jgi:hypothetical protein
MKTREVVANGVQHRSREPECREGVLDGLDPILDLDQVLATRPIARLQFQVASNHPVLPGLGLAETV